MKDIKDSLDRYVHDKIPPGGFLMAVLENNLMEAVGRAGLANRRRLPEICSYIYNCLPTDCYGNKERVKEWLDK